MGRASGFNFRAKNELKVYIHRLLVGRTPTREIVQTYRICSNVLLKEQGSVDFIRLDK